MRLQRVLALAALARASRPYPHPLLRDAAAVAYRAAAAKQFASVMPRLQAALLGNSSKASDRAAGDELLKAMGWAVTKLHGAFKVQFLCAQRGAGVLLNISAEFWQNSRPACRVVGYRTGHGQGATDARRHDRVGAPRLRATSVQ